MIRVEVYSSEILALEDNQVVGRLEYAIDGHRLSVLHTYAYISGRQIGSLLMQSIVHLAEEKGYDLVPVCSFAHKYLDKSINSQV